MVFDSKFTPMRKRKSAVIRIDFDLMLGRDRYRDQGITGEVDQVMKDAYQII